MKRKEKKRQTFAGGEDDEPFADEFGLATATTVLAATRAESYGVPRRCRDEKRRGDKEEARKARVDD